MYGISAWHESVIYIYVLFTCGWGLRADVRSREAVKPMLPRGWRVTKRWCRGLCSYIPGELKGDKEVVQEAIALQCTALHCIAVHCIALQRAALQRNALQRNAVPCF